VKKRLGLILTLLFIAGLFACSPFVYPRAGSGQKYRPPSRPSTSSRPSYSSSSKKSYTPSNSYTPYRSSSQYKSTPQQSWGSSGSYNKNNRKDQDDHYNRPVYQAPVSGSPSRGGCCCAPCGVFGFTFLMAFLFLMVLVVVII
jgi:hypothetical protein